MHITDYLSNLSEVSDFVDQFSDYSTGYICDIVSELADGNISLYTQDQIDYYQEHSDEVQEALWSGLAMEGKDFFECYPNASADDYIAHIGTAAWFVGAEREMYDNIDSCVLHCAAMSLMNDYDVEELADEQIEAMEAAVDTDCNNRLEDVVEDICAAIGYPKDDEE